jgi:hypothetical protein
MFCSRVTIARFHLPDKTNQLVNPVMANAAKAQIKSPAPPISTQSFYLVGANTNWIGLTATVTNITAPLDAVHHSSH